MVSLKYYIAFYWYPKQYARNWYLGRVKYQHGGIINTDFDSDSETENHAPLVVFRLMSSEHTPFPAGIKDPAGAASAEDVAMAVVEGGDGVGGGPGTCM